ncbi:hypothetical protein D3C85_1143490 [compost metagenome]
MQHLVGHAEGVGEGRALVGDAEQVLVRNDDQGVDVALQLGDAGVRQTHAVTAFEGEGLGHDADGQDAPVAGALGDDGGRAGAGAAAHAAGDEDHVRAVQVRVDFVSALLGGVHADFGVGAGAEALGDGLAQLDATVGLGEAQMLSVGVGDDELDPFKAGVDHIVHGVPARAADAEDDDPGLQFRVLRLHQRERHDCCSELSDPAR